MSRLVLVCVLVLVATASAVAVITAAHSQRSAHQPSYKLAGTDVWPAGVQHAPPFALRDQNGRLVTRSLLRGHIWAITFLDSHCREQCPVVASEVAHVQRLLGSNDPLVVVIVSVLPQYDTPARVRAFARKSGLVGDWHWLLGSKRQLAPVWRAYGIWVQTGIQHTAALYLVDQRGDVRVADGIPLIPSQLAGSVRALQRKAPARNAVSGA